MRAALADIRELTAAGRKPQPQPQPQPTTQNAEPAARCNRSGSTIGTDQDFATTLRDGRRVIGRREGSEWSIHVYSPDRQSRLLGYGAAATRPDALERAGLTGEDAGEVLGRIGI